MEHIEIVLRIRELTALWERQGGLNLKQDVELYELQLKANENGWIYW